MSANDAAVRAADGNAFHSADKSALWPTLCTAQRYAYWPAVLSAQRSAHAAAVYPAVGATLRSTDEPAEWSTNLVPVDSADRSAHGPAEQSA